MEDYKDKYKNHKAKYLRLINNDDAQLGGKNNKYNVDNFDNKMNELIEKIDSNYGLLITANNKIIYEKYVGRPKVTLCQEGNNSKTRFRIFSCSKPVTAMAIIILAQMKKIKLTDTIDKFCINVPHNDVITINHLLYHTSGVYDFSSELYFKLNPKKLFDKILGEYETKFVDFETHVQEINKNEPYFTPLKKSHDFDFKNYNNTGYDILGYIIYCASGMKTDEFIRKNIFNKLNMKNSGFQHEKHENESIPYENNKKQAIKEQQNWFCGNAYIVCTLRDYNKYLSNYEKLLEPKYLEMYKKLYFFGKINKNNKDYNYFVHRGAGDFRRQHSIGKEEYYPLSRTTAMKFFNEDKNVNVIVSENYPTNNGFFAHGQKNWNLIIENIMDMKL